jgi:AGZA family xanthine/uracil permease-like MFS transporter
LAGLALTFLAGDFSFRIFSQPLIGVVPMLLILIAYGASLKMPLRIPAGLVAVGVGLLFNVLYVEMGWHLPDMPKIQTQIGLTPPIPADLFGFIFYADGWKYITVIFPIGILGVLSAIQILDSAEAAGDHYPTRSSLLMNGIGTLCAASFGSAFTTALYIGHPSWKVLGARSAYSTLNGISIMLLCLFGGMTLVVQYVPMVAGLGIMMWIGIFMVVQAFQAVPKNHIPAVALGLIPALAGWALVLIQKAIGPTTDLYDVAPGLESRMFLSGIIALSQGSLISSMTLSAIFVYILDRKFLTASGWTLASAFLAFFGLIHAGKVIPHAGVVGVLGWNAAPGFALAYLVCAGALVLCHFGRAAGFLKVGDIAEGGH